MGTAERSVDPSATAELLAGRGEPHLGGLLALAEQGSAGGDSF